MAEFSGFGLELKLRKAADQPFSLSDGIELTSESLPVEESEIATKGGWNRLDEMIEKQVPTLSFTPGEERLLQ